MNGFNNYGQENNNNMQYNQNNQSYYQNYNQYNNNNTNYNNGNIQYQSYAGQYNNYEGNSKPKKQKKRRKHGCLSFLLTIILIIIVFNGIKLLCDKYAQSSFDKFMIDYPFTYFENDADTPNTITGNFELYNYREKDNKNVVWKSSDSNIVQIKKDGNILVTRPTDKSKNVTITGEYKWFIGKGYQKYNIVVLSSNIQSPEDFKVITKEDLENNTYNGNMKATLDKEGNITSMYGDFDNTHIYNPDDGLSWISAYKETLGIDNKISFIFLNSNESDSLKTYVYVAEYNGVKYNNQSIILTVHRNNFELFNVNCEFDREALSINNNIRENWEYKDIILNYMKENNIDANDIAIIPEEKLAYTYNEQVHTALKIYCVTDRDIPYIVYFDLSTCKVIELRNALTHGNIIGDGKDEMGQKRTFPISSTVGEKKDVYQLWDKGRNIVCHTQLGSYKWLQKVSEEGNDAGVLSLLGALLQLYGNELLELTIISPNKTFNDKVAVATYDNIIDVYDWYKNELNYISYDNKGSRIGIDVHSNMNIDNASWNNATKEITIGNVDKFKYTFAYDKAILGHEYTHAVFSALTASLEGGGDNPSLGAMNEAYADIFGCLISGTNTWKIGELYLKDGTKVYIRDIANYNNEDLYNTVLYGTKFPTKWHGENWDDEEHIGSVLISHIAWEMFNDEAFTADDIKNIWYDSLVLGYTEQSDFVSVRRNVIRAMDNRGFSKELQDKVAIWFDEEDIFDDQYVLTTTDNSVDGDLTLDNTTPRRYVIIVSVLGSALGDAPIYIHEETEKPNKEVEDLVNKELDNLWGSDESITNIRGEKIQIEYKQAPKWHIDILEKFVSSSRANLSDAMIGAVGGEIDTDTKNFFQKMIDLCIICTVQESTPYDIYNEMYSSLNNE